MTEAVDVEDHDKIVEFIMTSKVQRFPDAALRGFAVTNETVYSEQKVELMKWNTAYIIVNESSVWLLCIFVNLMICNLKKKISHTSKSGGTI